MVSYHIIGAMRLAPPYLLLFLLGSLVSLPTDLYSSEAPSPSQFDSLLKLPAEKRHQNINVLLGSPLKMSDAVKIGILNSPELRVQYQNLNLRLIETQKESKISNPVLAVGFKNEQSETRPEITMDQDILDWIHAQSQSKAVDDATKAETMKFSQELVEFVAKIKSAYISVEATQSLFDLQSQIKISAQASYELLQKQYNAGNISELQFRLGEASYQQAMMEYRTVSNELNQAKLNFQMSLGLFEDQNDWSLSETLSDQLPVVPNISDLDTLMDANRTDFKAYAYWIDSIQNSRSASVWKDRLGSLKAGIAIDPAESRSNRITPRFEVGIPLFSQGQLNDAENDQLIERLDTSKSEIKRTSHLRIRKIVNDLNLEVAQINTLKSRVIPLRTRSAELVQGNYNYMLTGPYSVIDARRSELAARQDLTRHLESFWQAWIQLEAEVGGRLE